MENISGPRRVKRDPVRWLLLAAMLAGCLWLAWNVPYTQDDWTWGQPEGLEWWRTGALNNRYVGTFFAVVMTRWPLAKTLVMGLTMFLLPLLAAAAADPGGRNRFPLSLLGGGLLMTMPAVSWRQTYGWVSAFANFVVLGVWMLLLLLLARTGTAEGYRGWRVPVLLFPLALTGQLFAEHAAALAAAAALGLAVWSLLRKRGRASALSLLAGTLLGLAVMFRNPLYGDLAATGSALDGIRHLAFSWDEGLWNILVVTVRRYFGVILPSLFENYYSIWAAVCAGALWTACRRRKVPLPLLVPAGAVCAGAVGNAWYAMEALRLDGGWVHPSPLLRAALPFGAVLVTAVLLLASMEWRAWLPRLALLGGALAMMLPFAALDENGPRCCFPSAALLLVLALSLLADLPWGRAGTAAAGILLAAALAFHLQIFQVVGDCYALRLELMAEAVEQGAARVVFPTESWRYYYTWGHNPQNARWAAAWRGFHGLPEDMELVFLPPGSYDLWPEVTEDLLAEAVAYGSDAFRTGEVVE